MKAFIRNFIRHLSITIIFLIGIELFMKLLKLSPAAFALPSEILLMMPKFFLPSGELYDLYSTVYRTIVAFLVSLPIGIVIGLFTSKISLVKDEASFVIDFVRSIPATALIPLFLVLFGPGDLSKITVGIFSGSLVIAISVLVGYQSLNKDRKRVSDLLNLNGFKRILYYELPEISPAIFVGARTAISLCLILVVVSEMFIGSKSGLGRIIMDRRYSDDVPTLYAAIVITGLVGYLINRLFLMIENYYKHKLGFII